MDIYIGQNIKYLCAEKNLRQSDFAELFEVKLGTLAGYIANRTEPPYAFSVKVCMHFKISLDDFITKDMAKSGYLPATGNLPQLQEPKAEYHTHDKIIIEAQAETIKALKKTIEVMERERDSGNFSTGATA